MKSIRAILIPTSEKGECFALCKGAHGYRQPRDAHEACLLPHNSAERLTGHMY